VGPFNSSTFFFIDPHKGRLSLSLSLGALHPSFWLSVFQLFLSSSCSLTNLEEEEYIQQPAMIFNPDPSSREFVA
jgi:hypothetical protein